MAKHKKRKTSAATARKRTSGRYKERSYLMGDGRKKPARNRALEANRAALAPNNPAMSTNPLDCARSNKFITSDQYKAALAYASARAAAGFTDGNVTASAEQEVELGTYSSKRSFSEMTFREIADAWDVMTDKTRGVRQESNGQSLADWKRLNAAMTPEQAREVYLVCVAKSWPFWITGKVAGAALERDIDARTAAEKRGRTDEEMAKLYKLQHRDHAPKYRLFVAGLDAVFQALWPTQEAVPARAPTPRHQKRTERTTYVDEDGNVLREVAVRRRVAEQA